MNSPFTGVGGVTISLYLIAAGSTSRSQAAGTPLTVTESISSPSKSSEKLLSGCSGRRGHRAGRHDRAGDRRARLRRVGSPRDPRRRSRARRSRRCRRWGTSRRTRCVRRRWARPPRSQVTVRPRCPPSAEGGQRGRRVAASSESGSSFESSWLSFWAERVPSSGRTPHRRDSTFHPRDEGFSPIRTAEPRGVRPDRLSPAGAAAAPAARHTRRGRARCSRWSTPRRPAHPTTRIRRARRSEGRC